MVVVAVTALVVAVVFVSSMRSKWFNLNLMYFDMCDSCGKLESVIC